MVDNELEKYPAHDRISDYVALYTGGSEDERIECEPLTHEFHRLLATQQADRELIRELVEPLIQTSEAYCGVGDFEGTGENMTTVIVQVRAAIQKANQRLKEV